MEAWIADLKYALRSLRKNPTLTTVALVTLALGIGANTAIFSVVHAVVLAPLPYPDADRLARVWPEIRVVSTEFYEHYRERTSAFAELSLYRPATFSLAGESRPEEIAGERVTPGLFAMLGVAPALGRVFVPQEVEPGQSAVVLLSHALWQRRFGGTSDAVGRSLVLDGREHTVVGVLPDSFVPLSEGAELWMPIEIDRASEMHWDWINYPLVGRLRPGTSRELAAEDLRAAVAAYHEKRPGYLSFARAAPSVVTWKESLTGGVRPRFALLLAAVGLVLLVACSNLANLFLARISTRRRELALRCALGAGRRRLIAQILTESTVLALAGGALGLLVASWTLAALVRELPASIPRTAAIQIDARVLVFTFALSLAAGLLFGLLPAAKAGGIELRSALATGRGATSGRHRLNRALVAAEVALAVLLVTGAGLLVKNFRSLRDVAPGFATERLLTLQLAPPATAYGDDEVRRGYFERVLERVRTIPGVESAALISRLPMTPGDVALSFRPADGDAPADLRSLSVRLTTPEILETLSIPLLRGRALDERDTATSPQVGLVNTTLATRLWGDADPLGRQVVFDTGELWFTVVGVLGDIRQHQLDQATVPQVYRPLAQEHWEPRMSLVVRSRAGAGELLAPLEETIWSVDSTVPISRVATMDQLVERTLRNPRLLTALFSLFGALALLLGMVGVFGVTSYTVSQQKHNDGVRLALGATASDVVTTALARMLAPVGAGLVAGALAAGWLTPLLGSFLSEVEPTDPTVLATVLVLLLACAALASWLPARRAAKADPMVVLRTD